jgi:hypothetical protein
MDHEIIYQEGANDDDYDEHLVAYRLEASQFVERSKDARIQTILILQADYIESERALSPL